VDQAAKSIVSSNAGVVVGRRREGPSVRWFLAEGPVRPVGVVAIDVFAEDVVEMSSAGDEDEVGTLTYWRVTIRTPAAAKTASNASVYLAALSLIRNFKPRSGTRRCVRSWC
jgi:hypothetical protein